MKNSYQDLCVIFQGERRMALANRLRKDYKWTISHANEAINQYLMFLSLASEQISGQNTEQTSGDGTAQISGDSRKGALSNSLETAAAPLVPTVDIDRVWEADILQNTEQYMQLCYRLCGEMIHHAEEEEIKAISRFEDMDMAFSQTCALLTERFGEDALGTAQSAGACGVLVNPARASKKDACGILVNPTRASKKAACGILVNPTRASKKAACGILLRPNKASRKAERV